MLVHIPKVLGDEQLDYMRGRLAEADWCDGRVTAGHQSAQVKQNLQLAENSAVASQLGELIVAALECNPLFISAVLPKTIYPPLFNRYEGGMNFGNHIDNAIRLNPHSGRYLRTDVSATLFLSEPDSYDGGELTIEDTYGRQQIKLAAGDMVVYPSTSLHHVKAVTAGVRLAAFFWVQSLVRDDGQRALLFDMDRAIQRLNQTGADQQAITGLTGNYHNLLRMWADT